MKKNKLIYTILFLTSAVSCSNFRPIVLTNAFLNPESVTNVTYANLNFSYALFNQFASGLNYSFRLDFTVLNTADVNSVIRWHDGTNTFFYNEWDTITSTFASTDTVSDLWKGRINAALFGRNFDVTTKRALLNPRLEIRRPIKDVVSLSVKINSIISYNVDVGSVYMAFFSQTDVDNFNTFIFFRNKQNQLLQTYLLDTHKTGGLLDRVYNLGTTVTNVRSFELQFQWIDTPPHVTTQFGYFFYEFNLFTLDQEIEIPDDASGDRFGFEFVAVEWWNILGHLQNFLWYLFNESPIAPLFQFIEDYVLVWISGLITFITGIFRL